MTGDGSQDDHDGGAPAAAGVAAAGAGGLALVFDAAGRLRAWTPAVAGLPGAWSRLAVGAELSSLRPLFDGSDWLDRPLSDGGVLRVAGAPAPSGAGDLTGRLFAAASHDLRQPLAALSLLIGTLDGRMPDGRMPADRSARDLLRSMAQAVESMRDMVDGHFDLARLEAGLIEPDIRPQAINGVLTRLALDVAPRFADRGVRFAVMPCSGIVHTDASLLERLLHGLVANALRHTARGRVLVGCRPRGDVLRVEVWDTGRGLSPRSSARCGTNWCGRMVTITVTVMIMVGRGLA